MNETQFRSMLLGSLEADHVADMKCTIYLMKNANYQQYIALLLSAIYQEENVRIVNVAITQLYNEIRCLKEDIVYNFSLPFIKEIPSAIQQCLSMGKIQDNFKLLMAYTLSYYHLYLSKRKHDYSMIPLLHSYYMVAEIRPYIIYCFHEIVEAGDLFGGFRLDFLLQVIGQNITDMLTYIPSTRLFFAVAMKKSDTRLHLIFDQLINISQTIKDDIFVRILSDFAVDCWEFIGSHLETIVNYLICQIEPTPQTGEPSLDLSDGGDQTNLNSHVSRNRSLNSNQPKKLSRLGRMAIMCLGSVAIGASKLPFAKSKYLGNAFKYLVKYVPSISEDEDDNENSYNVISHCHNYYNNYIIYYNDDINDKDDEDCQIALDAFETIFRSTKNPELFKPIFDIVKEVADLPQSMWRKTYAAFAALARADVSTFGILALPENIRMEAEFTNILLKFITPTSHPRIRLEVYRILSVLGKGFLNREDAKKFDLIDALLNQLEWELISVFPFHKLLAFKALRNIIRQMTVEQIVPYFDRFYASIIVETNKKYCNLNSFRAYLKFKISFKNFTIISPNLNIRLSRYIGLNFNRGDNIFEEIKDEIDVYLYQCIGFLVHNLNEKTKYILPHVRYILFSQILDDSEKQSDVLVEMIRCFITSIDIKLANFDGIKMFYLYLFNILYKMIHNFPNQNSVKCYDCIYDSMQMLILFLDNTFAVFFPKLWSDVLIDSRKIIEIYSTPPFSREFPMQSLYVDILSDEKTVKGYVLRNEVERVRKSLMILRSLMLIDIKSNIFLDYVMATCRSWIISSFPIEALQQESWAILITIIERFKNGQHLEFAFRCYLDSIRSFKSAPFLRYTVNMLIQLVDYISKFEWENPEIFGKLYRSIPTLSDQIISMMMNVKCRNNNKYFLKNLREKATKEYNQILLCTLDLVKDCFGVEPEIAYNLYHEVFSGPVRWYLLNPLSFEYAVLLEVLYCKTEDDEDNVIPFINYLLVVATDNFTPHEQVLFCYYEVGVLFDSFPLSEDTTFLSFYYNYFKNYMINYAEFDLNNNRSMISDYIKVAFVKFLKSNFDCFTREEIIIAFLSSVPLINEPRDSEVYIEFADRILENNFLFDE